MFYKPMEYSTTLAEFGPWVVIPFCGLVALFNVRSICIDKELSRLQAAVLLLLSAAGLAGLFWMGRTASIQWSHHFAPERAWEELEINVQAMALALGLGITSLVLGWTHRLPLTRVHSRIKGQIDAFISNPRHRMS